MIPVNEPLVGEKEIEYVLDCLRTGWISSSGKYLESFEQAWAEYCGMHYGIAVSNGTTALQVAVACLDLQPDDEVILPTFTIISCAQAVTYNGGIPVLVDSEPRTWCMDVSQIEARITPRTRAIMPVHIYGHPVDMDPLLTLAKKHGLVVIEDAAEAHGAEYQSGRNSSNPTWQRCGGLGDISVFSFYANKLVTTGEGGMVLTNDAALADKARSLRNLCFKRERRFYHTELGYNFRLTNLQAAIGLAQIERMPETIAKKRWIGENYTQRLRHISALQLPIEESWARQVYWMYGLVINEATGLDATKCARLLQQKGIETRPFFLGMHEQPIYQQMGLFGGEKYPVAERIARQGVYLPSGLTLTDEQLDKVCQVVEEILV
ncbi:MAG: aminotransferase DegT [Anaerolineales bacterium]|nr:DegT/DnrJ/EryC1/StrS family aminotransferase [Anaerolineae bacterium]PWB56878.1 MAG: aminotransferase DegT [Anaerolineales bacterium]